MACADPILLVGKLRPQEVKAYIQRHTAVRKEKGRGTVSHAFSSVAHHLWSCPITCPPEVAVEER